MTIREARWWHLDEQGRALCELCPRACALKEDQTGFCGVRRNQGGRLHTAVFGTSGLCMDPVEKKPLYHFLPGTEVLSFGTVGCNLGCVFCQNWGLSRSVDSSRLKAARPEDIARIAMEEACSGVAFTYNEPIISAEYCLEVAQACREAGLKTLAVTAGYISGKAREDFFRGMDGANVDLKGFSEAFYQQYCQARLEPVLETLEYLARETDVWLEITNLLIPGANDTPKELESLTAWIAAHLGADTPLHLSAFHPDHQLLDRPPTPAATQRRARKIAREQGLRYVYLGNIRDVEGSTTFCPGCGIALIARDGFRITSYSLKHGACPGCGTDIPGRFRDV